MIEPFRTILSPHSFNHIFGNSWCFTAGCYAGAGARPGRDGFAAESAGCAGAGRADGDGESAAGGGAAAAGAAGAEGRDEGRGAERRGAGGRKKTSNYSTLYDVFI